MLPARHRLRTAADFSAVVRGAGAVRSGGRFVVVHARYATTPDAADRPGPRVGFVVSKAVGGAVVRNRTKRVLRHLVAARLGRIPAGCDLVVRANPAAADATTPQLADDLERGLTAVLGRLAAPAGVPS
ncbi:MAG TPA: ribonuclease P protein component [Lapillicoccus sp.]|nr:ribonuclease P protein component [Lapillicoccus sp.]